MVSYSGLLHRIQNKGLTRTALGKELGISSRTLAKIGRGEKITDRVLSRIAEFLNCSIEDLYETIPSDPLLRTLCEEKSIRLPGGLYHEL